MPKHFLIPYVPLKGHKDPDFREFAYGDSGARALRLKRNISKGSHLIFHTRIGSDKYITGYIVVDRILSGLEAQYDDWLFIGDPKKSKKLRKPIPVGRSLVQKLSLNVDFSQLDRGERTQLQVIGSATRAQRQLTEEDIEILLSEINRYVANKKIVNPENVQHYLYFNDETVGVIPLDEAHKLREREIQQLIIKEPSVIENDIKVMDHEKRFQDKDRMDILFEAADNSIIVAELKGPNNLTDEIATQVASYARDIELEYPKRKIRKMIICDGKISPKLEKACENLGIEIIVYGIKLDCFTLNN